MKFANALFALLGVLLAASPVTSFAGEDPDKANYTKENPSGDEIYLVDDLPPSDVAQQPSRDISSNVPEIGEIPDPEDYGRIDALTRLENKLVDYYKARQARQAAESSATLREDGSVTGGSGTSVPSLDNVFLTMVYGDGENLIARVIFNGRYLEVSEGDELAPSVRVSNINPSFMDLVVAGKSLRLGLSSYQSLQNQRQMSPPTSGSETAPPMGNAPFVIEEMPIENDSALSGPGL